MQTPDERLNFLKWTSANLKKIRNMQAKIADMADKINSFPQLQDINLFSSASQLSNLFDRLDFLENNLDSTHFVNTGEIKEKEKGKKS